MLIRYGNIPVDTRQVRILWKLELVIENKDYWIIIRFKGLISYLEFELNKQIIMLTIIKLDYKECYQCEI